ncbi:MAG: TonB-dependent copper receptor [Janthinobacterium lividum]
MPPVSLPACRTALLLSLCCAPCVPCMAFPAIPPDAAAAAAAAAPVLHLAPLAPVAVTGAAPPDVPPSASAGTILVDPRRAPASLPASDGADFLAELPGFAAIRNGGSNGDPVLRGLSGSRLNILANGTTLLGACGSRMDAPTSYLTPETFDRVRIVRGPQTVLWGPVGSAGTVLFERLSDRFAAPGLRFHGALALGGAGRDDRLADLAAGSTAGDLRVIAQRARSDDYRDGGGRRVPSRWEKHNLDATLGWNLDAHSRLELSAGTGDGEARYAGRNMDGTRFRRDSGAVRFDRRAPDETVEAITLHAYANRADHVMDNFTLRDVGPPSAHASPHALRHASQRASGPVHAHGSDTIPMRMASNVERLTMGARAAATLRLGPDLRVDAGVDAQTQRHRARRRVPGVAVDDFGRRPWLRDADLVQLGGFGEASWTWRAAHRLIAGGRVDHVRARDRRVPVPAGAVTRRDAWLASGFVRVEHDLADLPLTVHAGLGHAGRFPDYWELFSPNSGPGANINAFSGVRPERTTQIDVGAHYAQGERQAWVAAYAGKVDDFIVFDYRSAPGSRVRQVDARLLGAELGGQWPLAPRWQVRASLAYAWAQDHHAHRPLPQVPPLEGRLALRYRHGRAEAGALWRVAASQHRLAVGQGNVAGRDLGASHGFGVLSLHAAYAVSKTARISVGVDNVLNKRYAAHLNKAGSAAFGYPATTRFDDPGRAAWAKLVLDI